MRISPETLARRIMQHLLLQGRMISIELQITPRDAGLCDASLYGFEIHGVRRISPHAECVTLSDNSSIPPLLHRDPTVALSCRGNQR